MIWFSCIVHTMTINKSVISSVFSITWISYELILKKRHSVSDQKVCQIDTYSIQTDRSIYSNWKWTNLEHLSMTILWNWENQHEANRLVHVNLKRKDRTIWESINHEIANTSHINNFVMRIMIWILQNDRLFH